MRSYRENSSDRSGSHGISFGRYEASFRIDENKPFDERIETVALGYVKPGGKMIFFSDDQNDIEVQLSEKDKLIVFSNH